MFSVCLMLKMLLISGRSVLFKEKEGELLAGKW